MIDIDDIPFDSLEDWDDDERCGRRDIRCRDCGAEDVYWVEREGKFILYDCTSRRHKCKAEHITASRLDAFENME